jgi:DNA-binding CsgD family transcriptional regulator
MTANSPGQQWTPRQREVLDLLAKGHTNGQIAERLGISLDGAKWHVSEILSKLQTNSRDEAADYWRRQNGLPARLARLSRAFAFGLPLRWAALGGMGIAAGLAVAVVFYVVAGGGEDAPANPGDDNDPTPTPPPSSTATPTPDGFETWGNFVLWTGTARFMVVQQDIPEDLQDFDHEPGDDPWLSELAHYIEGPDDGDNRLPRVSSRPPGMDLVLGAVLTDGLRVPEAITFYAESDPGLDELNVEERLALAREGNGFTLHATRLYTLPVYVEVADGPTESTPGVTAHPVEKVQVSANPAVLQRFEGAAVESGEHPRTVVRWFGQDIAYEARSPFDADLTLTLVQPDRLIVAALTIDPHISFQAHPFSVRTGEADVDVVLAALETRDPAALVPLMRFTEQPCTHEEGLGAFGCPEGVPEGTLLEAFYSPACHGTWVLREDALSRASWIVEFGGVPLFVHSVLGASDDEEPLAILLVHPVSMFTLHVIVEDGEILRTWSCGPSAASVAMDHSTGFLLPPPSYGPFVYVAGADTCLFVRSEPATDAAPFECIPEGAALRDLDETATDETGREWFAVQTLSGLNGWAAAEFLAPGELR